MQQRLNYYDFLRGIAIMMVVAIHTGPVCNFDSVENILVVIVRQLLNCAVPIFFAISGYFLAMKNLKTKKDIFIFWKHQIPKVYIPVLIWSLPYLLLSLYSGKELLYVFIQYLLCGYSIYYFIIVIIQFYLLLPILQDIKLGGTKICILISILSIIFTIYLLHIREFSLPLVIYAGHCDLWLMFFVIGIVLRRWVLRYSLYWLMGLIVILLICQVMESYWLYSFRGSGFGIKLSSFIFSMGVILFLFHPLIVNRYSEHHWFMRGIRMLGQNSFGIYLIHMFFIQILSFIGLANISWILLWFISLCLSTVTIIVSKRVFPDSFNRYIGF